jgi:hypothetical protein
MTEDGKDVCDDERRGVRKVAYIGGEFGDVMQKC